MADHEGNEASLMIVAMYHVRGMLPFCKPVANCNLKCDETFIVVIVTIDSLAIEQAVNVDKVKVESKFISLFPDNTIMEPMRAEMLSRFKLI